MARFSGYRRQIHATKHGVGIPQKRTNPQNRETKTNVGTLHWCAWLDAGPDDAWRRPLRGGKIGTHGSCPGDLSQAML